MQQLTLESDSDDEDDDNDDGMVDLSGDQDGVLWSIEDDPKYSVGSNVYTS